LFYRDGQLTARTGQSPLALSFPESGRSPRPNENARSAGVFVLAA
jgi:hypothetical protein